MPYHIAQHHLKVFYSSPLRPPIANTRNENHAVIVDTCEETMIEKLPVSFGWYWWPLARMLQLYPRETWYFKCLDSITTLQFSQQVQNPKNECEPSGDSQNGGVKQKKEPYNTSCSQGQFIFAKTVRKLFGPHQAVLYNWKLFQTWHALALLWWEKYFYQDWKFFRIF